MAVPCPESHESSPEASPPPSAQGGGSGGAEADVGRKMEEVVHLLEELKESVTELGDDVAGIKAEVENVHKKITAEAER
ncbi:hypothetical protein EJB05_14909 [Eragrostis curvula]|uniref:Uncharacterized protein n=1 Tax=Eragrostis curvula TaxID=38414 RepID=A0A5J9W1K7_9POAL|nr:hypothetical protein EJB05_14909 [Eragrostis curvula]